MIHSRNTCAWTLLSVTGWLAGCAGLEPGGAHRTTATDHLIAELCHDRVRLLTGLPSNELSEHEIPQLRQLQRDGQDAFFRKCAERYRARLQQP